MNQHLIKMKYLGRLVATEGLSKSEQLSRLMGSMTDDEMKVLGLSDMVIEKIKEALKQSHKQRENHDKRTPISERPKLKLFGGTETNAKSSIILERRVETLEQISQRPCRQIGQNRWIVLTSKKSSLSPCLKAE